ncbi:MAG TPA: universal stress protein UspA [Gammaproteobacteria bacterium]|nr:universal stress protein UspA [Gammaproteobacteria bacterium]HCL73680.1 universal stress protein UspA [Gammaproteobacteria bacterium]
MLAHVVEPIPKIWGMESYATNPDDLQDKILEKTKEMLNELGDKIGITERRVMLGGPASKIRELQAGYEADAIVIGSHGHSGWKLMLGSTAINPLHGATCDVLTVYVG